MGSEYNGYATDLTRSYPVNGKFTERQRRIHAAVTEAQTEVYAALRPGVEWKDMHRISERVIAKHLLDLGILQNGTVDEICENTYAVSALFSTGLGHLLGLNVHDVGGFHPRRSRMRRSPSTSTPTRCARSTGSAVAAWRTTSS